MNGVPVRMMRRPTSGGAERADVKDDVATDLQASDVPQGATDVFEVVALVSAVPQDPGHGRVDDDADVPAGVRLGEGDQLPGDFVLVNLSENLREAGHVAGRRRQGEHLKHVAVIEVAPEVGADQVQPRRLPIEVSCPDDAAPERAGVAQRVNDPPGRGGHVV